MKLRNLLRNLSDQVVKLRREEYFERVDRSRALGHSTSGEAATATVPRAKHARLCYGGEALDEVARFVQRYKCSSDEREKVETVPETILGIACRILDQSASSSKAGGQGGRSDSSGPHQHHQPIPRRKQAHVPPVQTIIFQSRLPHKSLQGVTCQERDIWSVISMS